MNDLLQFAASIANNTSSHFNAHYSLLVTAARRVVKAHGGELIKIGKYYHEGSSERRPYEKYINGKWVNPVYNAALDKWEFPSDSSQAVASPSSKP